MDKERRICTTSFTKLLTILFIGLKLTGFINWSWIWILSPMWISFLLLLVAAIIIALLNEK